MSVTYSRWDDIDGYSIVTFYTDSDVVRCVERNEYVAWIIAKHNQRADDWLGTFISSLNSNLSGSESREAHDAWVALNSDPLAREEVRESQDEAVYSASMHRVTVPQMAASFLNGSKLKPGFVWQSWERQEHRYSN